MSFQGLQGASYSANATKWRDILTTRSQIPNAWKFDPDPIFQNALEIEENEQLMEFDIFRLVGAYVEFGLGLFEENYLQNVTTDVEHRFVRLVRKYGAEEDPERSPSTISRLAAKCPYYVAEHLHLHRGRVIGKQYGLPRCLAFPGGLHFIPCEQEWKPLKILWQMWYSSISKCDSSSKQTAYLTLPYSHPLKGAETLLSTFDITTAPPANHVRNTIVNVLETAGFKGTLKYQDFHLTFSPCAADIYNFFTNT